TQQQDHDGDSPCSIYPCALCALFVSPCGWHLWDSCCSGWVAAKLHSILRQSSNRGCNPSSAPTSTSPGPATTSSLCWPATTGWCRSAPTSASVVSVSNYPPTWA